jgi:hypothetical protein
MDLCPSNRDHQREIPVMSERKRRTLRDFLRGHRSLALSLAFGLLSQMLVCAVIAQTRYTLTALIPNGVESWVTGGNNIGDIVGVYTWKDGSYHSFFIVIKIVPYTISDHLEIIRWRPALTITAILWAFTAQAMGSDGSGVILRQR